MDGGFGIHWRVVPMSQTCLRVRGCVVVQTTGWEVEKMSSSIISRVYDVEIVRLPLLGLACVVKCRWCPSRSVRGFLVFGFCTWRTNACGQ